MPEWLHKKLKRQAKKKGLSGERAGAYIYGTLNKYEKKKSNKSRRKRRRNKNG